MFMVVGCSAGEKPTSPPPRGADAPAAEPVAKPSEPAAPERPTPEPSMTPLQAPLEAELDGIRKDPGQAVGFGEKAFIPYQPNGADGLIKSPDAAVTARLRDEIRTGDRVFRLAALHVLGKRADAGVDPALIAALDDPALRATAAYLLGRPGFKG